MPRKRLTEEGVRRLKPTPGKQIDYFDTAQEGRGLVLRVNPGGTRTWGVLHYIGGKPRIHRLGHFPVLSVKVARERARGFLADPSAAIKEATAQTFGEVSAEFMRRHVEANKLRSRREIERILNKYMLPQWGDRSFTELRRGDVAELLDRIEDNHGARQADMVLAIIRKLMNWYEARHDDYRSPVVKGMGRAKPSERRRRRILDDGELRALWLACDRAGSFGSLIKFLLLTAQRRDKAATMKWSDLDSDTWRIAGEAREKANARVLKLPMMAFAIINVQPRIAENAFVFAGRGAGPFNSWSQRKAELDAAIEDFRKRENSDAGPMLPWVIHDLRRSARSLMSRAGVRPDIAERVLGHAIIGVEAVYDQHDYDNEKALALKALASLVERIVNPIGNVIDLRGQERAT